MVGHLHLADRSRPLATDVAAHHIALVDATVRASIQIKEAGSGLAEVSGDRRQQCAGSHHVAARPLALQSLSKPEQRRPAAVEACGGRDLIRGHARHQLTPLRSAIGKQRGEVFPSHRVCPDELRVNKTLTLDHVHQRKREGRITAGEGLQM